MHGVCDAFYQALSMKCDLSRAKLKLLVCGINIHVFMQMHPYNAIDISLHHIKLKFVQIKKSVLQCNDLAKLKLRMLDRSSTKQWNYLVSQRLMGLIGTLKRQFGRR